MKKLLPLITLLLLLTSCQGLIDAIIEAFGDEPIEERESSMESICETLDKDGLISFLFKVDPDITNVLEIEKIQYTFSYSNGGAENINVNLNIDESFQRSDDTTYISRNSFSRDIVVYPTESIELTDEDDPFEVAEIMIDKPGGDKERFTTLRDLVYSEENLETKDCCNTIAMSLSNVVVTLKDGTQKPIKLPGCYRMFETGKCCDIKS